MREEPNKWSTKCAQWATVAESEWHDSSLFPSVRIQDRCRLGLRLLLEYRRHQEGLECSRVHNFSWWWSHAALFLHQSGDREDQLAHRIRALVCFTYQIFYVWELLDSYLLTSFAIARRYDGAICAFANQLDCLILFRQLEHDSLEIGASEARDLWSARNASRLFLSSVVLRLRLFDHLCLLETKQ